MLELHNLSLMPGTGPIDHTFREGTISVVLGRNRSGKTLLARTIAGLERPAAGRLLQDGVDVTDAAPGARSVALVYQAFVNYPTWTVQENLASPLVAQRRGRAEIRARVNDIAAKLELTELLDRRPETLSGGQQQRVAIGRALAKGARVLVMDEPLVNLDYKLRETLQLELRALLHAERVAVIYTTSDPRDAFALGDSVLLLAAHRIVQTGSPVDVYQRPASPAAMDLMSDPSANRSTATGVLRMVRPEHLALTRAAADDVGFDVTAVAVETNGSETYLHCDADGAPWVARLEGLARLEAGASCRLYAPRTFVHEFEGARADG